MKKILIVSVSVGNGHTKAALALKKTAELFFPQIVVEHVDFLDFVNIASKKIFFDTYDLMVKNAPYLYRMLYDAADKKTGYNFLEKITLINKKLNTNKFRDFVLNFSPEAIIFTHFVPAEIFNSLDSNIFSATVITDYENHRLWFTGNNQKYFVAHEKIKDQLIDLECNKENIFVSGIPIDPGFFNELDEKQKKHLRDKLEIDGSKKIVVVMPCGKGKINPINLTNNILNDKNNAVLALSGHDVALQDDYKRIKNSSLKVIGWTDSVVQYMQLAEYVITKPGGLVVSECHFLNKPMIFVNPIPGQEEKNAQYMESINSGVLLKCEADWPVVLKHAQELKTHNKVPNRKAAKIILEHVLNSI